jgi:hypothetical protein
MDYLPLEEYDPFIAVMVDLEVELVEVELLLVAELDVVDYQQVKEFAREVLTERKENIYFHIKIYTIYYSRHRSQPFGKPLKFLIGKDSVVFN